MPHIKEKSKRFMSWFGSQIKFRVKPLRASLFESLFKTYSLLRLLPVITKLGVKIQQNVSTYTVLIKSMLDVGQGILTSF